jgi:hypothetical protein
MKAIPAPFLDYWHLPSSQDCDFKTTQTLSTNNDTKPLQCHSMAASQTYYYPCPEIGLNQKNTDCKMQEQVLRERWKGKDSSEEAQEAIVSE